MQRVWRVLWLRKCPCLYKKLRLPLAFLTTDLAILSPLRFSSRVIPKYLTELVGFIILPSQDTSNLSTLLNLCCDPKRMDSVLPRCKDNSLSISHCLQDSSSLLKTSEIILLILLICTYINAKFIVICKPWTLNDGGEDSVKYRNRKKHRFLAAVILLFIVQIIITW